MVKDGLSSFRKLKNILSQRKLEKFTKSYLRHGYSSESSPSKMQNIDMVGLVDGSQSMSRAFSTNESYPKKPASQEVNE